MSRVLPVLAMGLLVAACGKTPDAPTTATIPAPAAPAAATPVAASVAAATPRAMRVRGAGVVGKDGYGVTLCGEDVQRIVELEPAARTVLDAFLANGARQFRVDAWATWSAPTGCGCRP